MTTKQGEKSRDGEILLSLLESTVNFTYKPLSKVDKPWGKEIWWTVTNDYIGKIIEVHAGHSLSLQYHQHKRETMFFLEGNGILQLGEGFVTIKPGLIVEIPPKAIHRITADSTIVLLEVSTPQVDDVVRLEDNYGRAK